MSDTPMTKVEALKRLIAQDTLIRVTLGLNPIHDPVEAVRVLYEEGRAAFEKLRGDPCEHSMHTIYNQRWPNGADRPEGYPSSL